VSRPWLGYGNVLFLELGALRPLLITVPKRRPFKSLRGQATLLIHSDWRVESAGNFRFGSGTPPKQLERGLRTLRGLRVRSITTHGELPELIVLLDKEFRIRSFSAWSGPHWDFSLEDPKRFPRSRRWNGVDHSLHVGFDDEHGLTRSVGFPTKPSRA